MSWMWLETSDGHLTQAPWRRRNMRSPKIPLWAYWRKCGRKTVQGDESVFQAWLVCHLGADMAKYSPITIRSETQSTVRDWGSLERFLNSGMLWLNNVENTRCIVESEGGQEWEQEYCPVDFRRGPVERQVVTMVIVRNGYIRELLKRFTEGYANDENVCAQSGNGERSVIFGFWSLRYGGME